MKYKYIPVNNNLDKAVAFANSLDNNFITNTQRIKQKEYYIPTLDVIKNLQNEGWILKGVDEYRDKSRKITHNYTQLQHPDFPIKNQLKKDESYPAITISNSCSGNSPLKINMGVYRVVCSNGLVRSENQENSEIKHNQISCLELPSIVKRISDKSYDLINEIDLMKYKLLTQDQIKDLAIKAINIKYNEYDPNKVNFNDIIKINRDEDKGNDVWSIFNRVQENLTHDIRIKAHDIKINQQLYDLFYNEAEIV